MHSEHEEMAAQVEGSMKCRKCERGKVLLGRDERKIKECRAGKSRKEESVEKMGPNGWPWNPEKGDIRRFSAFNI